MSEIQQLKWQKTIIDNDCVYNNDKRMKVGYEMKKSWNLDNSYEQLPPIFYSHVTANRVQQPQIVVWNELLAAELKLDEETFKDADILAGNEFPEDASQLAQSYAGHQFGHLNMLGDGRATLIGEKVLDDGRRIDIQLKGSGLTPYSRGGDGRAALGPMVREYIISEAMHALRIPTTRSLAVTLTGEPVYRETVLQGAVLTRIAASHLRVGTFAFAAHYAKMEDLVALADYAIARHYPHLTNEPNRYVLFLRDMMERQAKLISQWQLVGFIHGVMNTDNMTISGETIDYGPCAFMDSFDPDTVFSSIDTQGRYAFGNQPSIGGWNIARFAECLLPLLADEEEEAISIAKAELANYPKRFMHYYQQGMRAKLGMLSEQPTDDELTKQFLQLLMKYDADYTNSFRALTEKVKPAESFFLTNDFKEWEEKWLARLVLESRPLEQIFNEMNEVNPAVIARNHQVERAITAAEQGDFSIMHKLVEVLRTPFELAPKNAEYKYPNDDDQPYRTFCGT